MRTLIFVPYDSQGISIIHPVKGSTINDLGGARRKTWKGIFFSPRTASVKFFLPGEGLSKNFLSQRRAVKNFSFTEKSHQKNVFSQRRSFEKIFPQRLVIKKFLSLRKSNQKFSFLDKGNQKIFFPREDLSKKKKSSLRRGIKNFFSRFPPGPPPDH